MKTFPTKGAPLERGESPSLYDLKFEDNVNKAPTDGGYEHRRRQFTRMPRRILATGFINLNHADYLVLEAFYLEHQMDREFIYRDYLMGVDRVCRFDEFKPDAKSVGQNRRWDLKIKLSEV